MTDLNGDGKPDIVTVDAGNVPSGSTNNVGGVSVLINAGSGAFRQPKTYIGSGFRSLFGAAGDFDGDGDRDIAVTNEINNGAPTDLTLFRGDGTGNLVADSAVESANPATLTDNPLGIVSGDFNRDGISDVAVANSHNRENLIDPGNIGVLLGNNPSGFGTPTSYQQSYAGQNWEPRELARGDFNEDGFADIAAVTGADHVAIRLGDGHGGFGAAMTSAGEVPNPLGITVGDLNGDGHLDVAVGNFAASGISLLFGDGTGHLGPNTEIAQCLGADPPPCVVPSDVQAADINGDGALDLVVGDGYFNDVVVLLGDGTGGFGQPEKVGDISDFPTLAIGDFNGDGKPDIAATSQDGHFVSVYLNTTERPSKASPTIATRASSGGPVGTKVHDTATVSGGNSPTGTVTFKLFTTNACTTQVGATSTTNLVAGSATSDPLTPPSPGTYYWTAVYSGDANNNPATSACNAPNESVTITQASPTISTQALAGGPVGTALTDTATVAGGSSPTGTVTFKLFTTNTCTTQVGATSTKNLTGGSATSDPVTPASPGTYYWTAVYSGDANNNPTTSPCNAPNESATITKASPTLSTQASSGNLLGAPVRDVATVAGGLNPTGTVTFRLFSDSTCATQVFSSANPLLGTSSTSDWFTPIAPGTYWWTAVYGGDANNNGATSACRAANESVVIAPFAAPSPTRTITGDFTGPVTVNAGESWLLTNARVVGPITVNPGGSLSVVNSQISRGITANAPMFLSLCGAQVSGPPPAVALSVSNANVPIRIGDPANGCATNRFAGDVTLMSNLAVTFGANVVSGIVTANNNGPGKTVLKANNVFGALSCAGNAPPPTNAGQANAAGSKAGQCIAM